MEDIRLAGGKLRGWLRFGKSRLAKEVYEDVRAGILKDLSVGYSVDAEPERLSKGRYRVNRWTPLEVSLLSIPADHTVGVGRAYNSTQEEVIKIMNDTPNPENERGFQPDGAAAERERVVALQALGKRFELAEQAQHAVAQGTSVQSFREFCADNVLRRSKAPSAPDFVGMSPREVENFSFRKLILATATNEWNDAGLEREAVRAAGPGKHGGFLIPVDVLAAPVQRAIGTTISHSDAVPTQHLSSSFIEYLRDRTIVRQLGATVLGGLQGNVEVPRQSASATVGWVAENSEVSESILAIDNVTLTPRTVGAYSDFTRRLMLQADPSVEMLVRNDLAGAVAVAIDRAAFNGAGGDAPMGILTVSGVPTVNLTSNELDFAAIVELESTVAGNNADVGRLAYAVNPATRGYLKTTPKASGTDNGFIWDGERLDANGFGALNGYPAAVSNIIPANMSGSYSALVFGDFSSVLLGEWATVEVATDPYALFKSGGLRVRCFADLDVALRRLQSFAVIRDADVSGS